MGISSLFSPADRINRAGSGASAFDFDGVRIERFYHFICRNDKTLIDTVHRLGIGHRLRWKSTKTAFFYDGQLFKFGSPFDLLRFSPLTLVDKLRFGFNVLYSKRFTRWPLLEDLPAKQWLIDCLGQRCYSVIWDPLLRVKFDTYHEQISAAWMWHRIHRVATSRKSIFKAEEFGYIEGGSDTTMHALAAKAQEAGARLHLNTPCSGLWTDGENCLGIRFGDRNEPYDRVVCAVPLPVYRKLIPQDHPEYAQRLQSIKFIGVVCMILKLKHAVSENFWLNIHDPRISFNGIIEYSNLNDDPTYGGQHIVYVPFYLEQTRDRYSFPDEQLFREYVDALKIINPRFSADWVEGYRVFRAPHAQPVCSGRFSELVPPSETPWDRAYLIESTQLYPADRVISGTMRLAQDVVLKILERDGIAHRAPFPRRAPHEIPA